MCIYAHNSILSYKNILLLKKIGLRAFQGAEHPLIIIALLFALDNICMYIITASLLKEHLYNTVCEIGLYAGQ